MQSAEKIIALMCELLNADSMTKLAEIIGVDQSTISTWKRRKKVPDGVIDIVSGLSGISFEELKYGKKPTFSVMDGGTDHTYDRPSTSPYIEKVAKMMSDMDEDMQKDICLSVEKEKLLRDLLRQKESDEKAG